MKNLDFAWLTDEFMLYCRSTQLWEKVCSAAKAAEARLLIPGKGMS